MNASSWVTRRRPVRSLQPVTNRGSGGPRFERFAAAMQAEPPPAAQVLADPPGDPQVQPAPRATPIRVAPPLAAQEPAQHPADPPFIGPSTGSTARAPFVGPPRGSKTGAPPMARRPVQNRFDGADSM